MLQNQKPTSQIFFCRKQYIKPFAKATKMHGNAPIEKRLGVHRLRPDKDRNFIETGATLMLYMMTA